ncbi:DUF2244 domain-containing protein [Acidisphaera rubrifaciens]|uniref:Integral membrane protein n=1 Tax=Acidisphaera rubrifaciens HS-AP3 TaxID=1231350 RepID=A0A0D6P5K5_9PROT|nr:DUF2244 domain-containing protein [Acidisphaera rubrifaciens]GAN77060.1 hypothetical protein Asru_0225_06 [Acidisphaera rubrifaciens HS-AP3]
MDTQAPIPPVFEAVIRPYRSLSPRGVRTLAAVIVALSALIGLRACLMGAWPVIGFSIPEVALIVFLLRLNMARARARETIRLSAEALSVERIDRHGRRTGSTLPAAWLTIVVEERPGRIPALLLTTRHLREEIAAFLGEYEKRDLASALQAALRAMRSPVFDNPQLREGSA